VMDRIMAHLEVCQDCRPKRFTFVTWMAPLMLAAGFAILGMWLFGAFGR
jgi:hypothetical protein